MWTWLYKKEKNNYILLTWSEWNSGDLWVKLLDYVEDEKLQRWINTNSSLFDMLFSESFVRVPFYIEKEREKQYKILVAWVAKIILENSDKYFNLKEFNSTSLITKFKDKLSADLESSSNYSNEGNNSNISTTEDTNKNFLNNQTKLVNEDDWKNNKFLSNSTDSKTNDKTNYNFEGKGSNSETVKRTLEQQQNIKEMLQTLDKIKNADMWLLEVLSNEILTNNIVKRRKDY